MCVVIEFRRHAETLVSTDDINRANASKVMCDLPLRFAKRTSDGQRLAGIPRSRQELTVLLGRSNSADTMPVPPRSSMTESFESAMAANMVRKSRTSQEFATRETTFELEPVPIPAMTDTLKEQAKRLKDTREALGFATQEAFCKEIGVAKNLYNPYEKGKRPITLAAAMKIKRRFKIGLDWTIDGDPDDLPGHLFRKLARNAA